MALIEFQNNTAPYLNAENLNNNFNELKNAIEIKVVTANLIVEAGNTSGNVSVELPDGYTRDNCAVIFKNFDTGTGNKTDSPNIGAAVAYDSYDNFNYLYITLANLNTVSRDTTFIVRVGLIKVDYNGGNNE